MADEAGSVVAESPRDEEENGPTIEELQSQLAEMEATQSELADRLQTENSEPKLDQRFAIIEEQFRSSFDDRLRSSSSVLTTSGRPATGDQLRPEIDLLLVNKVFRDVSRLMADEWRPVFDGLMAGFSEEVISSEKEALEKQPCLIQGYKSLLVWKELCADKFDILQLVEVLKKSDMEDIAETAAALLEKRDGSSEGKGKTSKPVQRRKSDVSRPKSNFLDNRRILLLSKKVGGDWESLGKALGVPDEELAEIKEGPDGSSYHGAFKMLWAWRQLQPPIEDAASTEALRQALQQVNKGHFIDEVVAT